MSIRIKLTEASLQSKIISYARSLKLLARRNYMGPGVEIGWPDVTIYGPNRRVLFIEVKAPGEEPKKIQQYRALQLRRLGHRVETCDDLEQAKRVIDEII